MSPDYIFVDFNMPEINCLEFLVTIKDQTNLRNTKIYLHSMRVTNETYRAAVLAGASGCIKKVNTTAELTNELIAVLVPDPKSASTFLNGKSSN
jgi:CheY-like chemotaxis protein